MAQNAIFYGSVNSEDELKNRYPDIKRKDMDTLRGMLESSQKVVASDVNRLFDVYNGTEDAAKLSTEKRRALALQKKECLQYVIMEAQKTNRGNDSAYLEGLVQNFMMSGVYKSTGRFYDDKALYGQAVLQGRANDFVPTVTDEEHNAVLEEFNRDEDLKARYMEENSNNVGYAVRARALDLKEGAFGVREPTRPQDVPENAVWDSKRMGWVLGDKFRGWNGN